MAIRGDIPRPSAGKISGRLWGVSHGRRQGVTPVGAHRLRHAAAADMLRHGASLIEIGQVLRHRDVATTAAYANPRKFHLTRVGLVGTLKE